MNISKLQDSENNPFDVGAAIKGTDSSLSDIVARIQTVIGVVAEFDTTKQPNLIPVGTLNNLESSVTEAKTAIEAANRTILALESAGGVQSIDYANFLIVARNGTSHQLDIPLLALHSATEGLLIRFFESVFILKPRTSYSFQAAANGLSRLLETIIKDTSSAHDAQKKLNTYQQTLEKLSNDASAIYEEIRRLKSESESERKSISEYLSKSTENSAAIQAVNDEASELQVTTKASQEALDLFQKRLAERNDKFEQGSRALDALVEEFTTKRQNVSDLTQRAEEMLSSATVAGLASHFSDIRGELTSELWWARVGFYFSILVLFVSAIPLFAIVAVPIAAPLIMYYFPEIHLPDAPQQGVLNSEWQYLAQVLGRILILLPAAWLVRFAAIRHSSLFRLREHYAYKYSMAVSVEGFKKQAPDYQQQIAAMVLEQLAFNPADKLVPSKDIKEGKVPGLMAFLLDKIREDGEVSTERPK